MSRPGSRSPSPSGRVSPFRGRGFNPIGSRHASPIPSPTPPHDERTDYYGNNYSSNNNNNNNNSNYGNSNASKVILSPRTIKRKQAKLSPQLSKSLTNIGSKISIKPPPSPRRNGVFSKTTAFQQLSPITGSSPDTPELNSHHQLQQQEQHERKKSSSSKIPRSRSQPPSRKPSPNTSRSVSPRNTSTSQENSRPSSRNESRNGSKNVSRNPSRNPSRSQSPNKGNPLSPTRVKNKYSNIQPKVNSFNNRSNKPKVPQKPNFDSEDSVVEDAKDHKRLDNKNSELKRTKNRSNLSNSNLASYKTSVINRNINNKKTNNSEQNNSKSKTNNNNNNKNNSSRTGSKREINKKYDEIETVTETSTPDHQQTSLKRTENDTKLNETFPSTVVSSTTSTVTQPLKIDAKLDLNSEEILKIKPTPMYMDEGRVLSATSVSTAINRMNDTVLDSQTLMKDHNFTKLSPAATAIISMSETNRSKLAFDPKTATTALPVVDVSQKVKEILDGANKTNSSTDSNLSHPNHDSGLLKHKNNLNKMNSIDNSVGLLQNVLQETGSNGLEGRLEGRTVIAKDVKPIRITVKEKPMDPEVQSGNVRLSGSIVNGSITGVRPS